MREPNPRTSRLTIAAGLVVAIAIGAAGFFLGRSTAPPPPRPAPTPPPVVTPPPPPVQQVLGRADIVALAGRAADALAAGAPLPGDVADAAGRRFELALPFGCDGPVPETSTAALRWRYDAAEQTLRVHAAPTRWSAGDWQLDAAAGATAGFEGFWVSRPWSLAERCPRPRGQAVATDIQPVTLPGQTLAIAAQLADDARRAAGDDARSYDIVKRVPPQRIAATQGFRLRLIGRIGRLGDGQTVRCIQPAGIEQRPICLVLATIDEIRIENPLDDAVLGTWSVARGG
jgi:hypothetical protein